jgi:hypothetical protein
VEVGICGRLGHHARNNTDHVDVFQKKEMVKEFFACLGRYDQASRTLIMFAHKEMNEALLKGL